MAEHAHSGTIQAAPQRVFDYLSDIEHLPDYFPGMKHAHDEGPDPAHHAERIEVEAQIGGTEREAEGWFRVDRDARRIEWGALDDNGYRGWLAVEPEGPSASSLSLSLNTPHVDEGDLDLEDAIERVRLALKSDVEADS